MLNLFFSLSLSQSRTLSLAFSIHTTFVRCTPYQQQCVTQTRAYTKLRISHTAHHLHELKILHRLIRLLRIEIRSWAGCFSSHLWQRTHIRFTKAFPMIFIRFNSRTGGFHSARLSNGISSKMPPYQPICSLWYTIIGIHHHSVVRCHHQASK